ncbi:YqcI/YcgG family protein [Halobaculum magnesiiphilum]|uniref:YqcI/YcgG family protein n=1 Tax=Halobaculum magnesiiphilum TaxID=1017351 RepID=A0A8T8WBS4_9EURY|nr:YqcI/YcgG family protein [Halobaculum magnesiiphilum]QZP37322.1 YqcI/YcgG family protein [Halobaculum magnesiiphilum]
MNEPHLQSLCDQETMIERARADDAPEWLTRHVETFTGALTGERNGTPFPCHFGTNAVERGDLLYAAVPSLTDPDALFGFRDALLEYLDTYQSHAELAPLVTFFAPPEAVGEGGGVEAVPEADWHEALWHVLQFLHVNDPEPWPEDVPTDPDDPHWEFCFGGTPMFPTSRAPFYDDRRSRYCPVGLEITFQPRDVFDGLTHDTEAGARAREVIQGRLGDYDGVCPHADLGDYGVEGDREWRQYLFSADESQFPDECPLTVTREVTALDADPGGVGAD